MGDDGDVHFIKEMRQRGWWLKKLARGIQVSTQTIDDRDRAWRAFCGWINTGERKQLFFWFESLIFCMTEPETQALRRETENSIDLNAVVNRVTMELFINCGDELFVVNGWLGLTDVFRWGIGIWH